ncbi:MAG: hypothetical protein [Caudoviricetes sp.]|nr:MAG: hypothetical protein [Caudoviricetes sp.]
MEFEDRKIVLEHGFIEINISEKGKEYQKYYEIEFYVEYELKQYNVFKYKTFNSLHDAYKWYKKIDLDMKGI